MHMQKMLNFLFLCAHYCAFVQCRCLRAYAASANPTLTSHVTTIHYKALNLALWPWPPWFLNPKVKHLYQSLQYPPNVLITVYKKKTLGAYSMNGIISYIVVILFSKISKWDDIKITWTNTSRKIKGYITIRWYWGNFLLQPNRTLEHQNQKHQPFLFNIYCLHYLGLHLKALASYSSHAVPFIYISCLPSSAPASLKCVLVRSCSLGRI